MCACVPFMRPVFDRRTARSHSLASNGVSTTTVASHAGGTGALHRAKRSMDNDGRHRERNGDSVSDVAEMENVPASVAGASHEWRDVENYPNGAIRVEKSFIVNSDYP